MAGVGFNELVLLFIIGLLILGPERLPRVASQLGRWVGRARRTANQMRYQLEREIALADIKKSSKPPRTDKAEKQSAASETSTEGETETPQGADVPDTGGASAEPTIHAPEGASGEQRAEDAAAGSRDERKG